MVGQTFLIYRHTGTLGYNELGYNKQIFKIISVSKPCLSMFIDAHGGRGGRRGAPHVPSLKAAKSWIIKMQ